jgi:hypothetical protein
MLRGEFEPKRKELTGIFRKMSMKTSYFVTFAKYYSRRIAKSRRLRWAGCTCGSYEKCMQ